MSGAAIIAVVTAIAVAAIGAVPASAQADPGARTPSMPITAMGSDISGPGSGVIGVTTAADWPIGNGWQTDFACTWAVPAGAQPGDFFTLTLPPELAWATSGTFPLYATGSTTVVVAEGTMDPGPPATVTFELTDYFVDHRDGASGDCRFSTIFETTSTDDTVSVDFDLGGTVVSLELDVRNCPDECPELTAPVKGGWWTDSAVHDRITFHIRTARTPIEGDVIIDDTAVGADLDHDGEPDFATAGYVLDCDARTAFSFDVDSETDPIVPGTSGQRSGEFAGGEYREYLGEDEVPALYTPIIDCSPTHLVITWPDLPAGVAVNAHYHATVTEPGREAYANDAVVTMGDHVVHSVHSDVLLNTPSGSGAGPAIHLEKWNDEGGAPTLHPVADCDQHVVECFAGDYDVAPGAVLGAGQQVDVVFTITNTGDQPLYGIEVTDALVAGTFGAIDDLSCDFSPLGGPDSGTTWLETAPDDPAAAFQPDASFECTGTMPGLAAGQSHADRATVTARNLPGDDVNGDPIPETTVSDDDPWNATAPAVTVAEPPTTPLPATGSSGSGSPVLAATALTVLGALLMGAARRRALRGRSNPVSG